MIIIIIRGFAGSGKDTFGNIFVKEYGFHRIAFADELKEIVSSKYGVTLETLHSQDGKLQKCECENVTWREILLQEGRDQRANDPAIFAKGAAKTMRALGHERYVITDWRYDNEIVTLQGEFPDSIIYCIWLRRVGQDTSPVTDISETQLLGRVGDIEIWNDTYSGLCKDARALMSHI